MSDGGAGGGGMGAPRGSRPGPRSRRLQRMMDEGPRTSGKTWAQLLLLVVLLVLLFVSRDEIGQRAAGCYGVVEGNGAASPTLAAPEGPAPSAPAGPASEDAVEDVPRGTGAVVPATVLIERRPPAPPDPP
jgi:hypothetical protein